MSDDSKPIEAASAPSIIQSGTQLDSILTALAAMPPPPPPVSGGGGGGGSSRQDTVPRAPSSSSSTPAETSPRVAAPTQVVQRHFAHVPSLSSAFYNNSFTDPEWYKSHSQTIHAPLDPSARASESAKSKHVPLEHIQESSKKFYQNSFQDPAWKISHTHTVHLPLDKSLPPYASAASGLPSGQGSAQYADLPPPPVPEKHQTPALPPFAPEPDRGVPRPEAGTAHPVTRTRTRQQGENSKSVAISDRNYDQETQEYYLDSRHSGDHNVNAFAALEKEKSNSTTIGAFLSSDRPKKSSRYLAQYCLVSPLEYSKDYVPHALGGPASPPLAKNRKHMNHSDEIAGVLVSLQTDTAAVGDIDPLYNQKRNDRFSRKEKRIKAAGNISEEKYIPKMAVVNNFLGHALRTKDASKSGFVNFDEFKSALKQADILLSYEEYLAVFNKFTDSSGNTQPPVPVRSASTTPREGGSPPSGKSSGRSSPTSAELQTREKFKGFIGSLSAGKVLNIGDFLEDVKVLSEKNAEKGIHVKNIALPAHMLPSNKQKRNVFFKVLHSINKAADPSRIFRHLDDELLGHLRPSALRRGLDRLGASLTNNEFNALLKGIGYNDASGKEFINLDTFDRILHNELSTSGGMADASDAAAPTPNASASSSSSSSTKVPINGDRDNVGWEDHRRKKKSYTVPGLGQELQQQHLQEVDRADSRYVLTEKITGFASPSGTTAAATAAAVSTSAAALASSSSIRLDKMRAILQCLQPNQTEFTRMVESQHTREASLKWCKLQSKLQGNANHVLNAFKKGDGDDLNKRRSHSHSTAYRRGHGEVAAIRTDELSELTIGELENKLSKAGFVLGNEDKAIMRFHLQNQAESSGSGEEKSNKNGASTSTSNGNGKGKGMINLQSFCQAVGIPVTVTRSRFLDQGEIQHHMELQHHMLEDGGIFACSQHNITGGSSNSRAAVGDSVAVQPAATLTTQGAADPVAFFNPNFSCTMFNDDVDSSWMKGMRKRRVECPQASTNIFEPWKFLALLEHGSSGIWPTAPASAEAHKDSGGSFHFTRRHVIQDNEAESANGQRRAGRSSSAPPGGKRTFQFAPVSNSEQFRASQNWTPQQYIDEQRGRGKGRGRGGDAVTSTSGPVHVSTSDKANTMQVHDVEKLKRWAAKPLVEKYFDGKVDLSHREATVSASAALNQSGTVSSRSHHLSPGGQGHGSDSSRNMKHTLRKSNPFNSNTRPSVTPFALDN